MQDVHQGRETSMVDALPSGDARPDALAFLYVDLALGLGMHLVANLAPSVWELPFDQVTVPLLGSAPPA